MCVSSYSGRDLLSHSSSSEIRSLCTLTKLKARSSTDLYLHTRRRGGALREPAGVILDVPHILKKLKMRRYEALDSESAFPRCKSRCKIASDWFNRTKKRNLLPATRPGDVGWWR